MPRRDRLRVLVLAVIAALALAAAWGWLKRFGMPGDPLERAREKAAELQRRAREVTR